MLPASPLLHLPPLTSHTQMQQQQYIIQHRVLLTAYAAYLQPSWFSEEAYLWAVELWYAYAIQVLRGRSPRVSATN